MFAPAKESIRVAVEIVGQQTHRARGIRKLGQRFVQFADERRVRAGHAAQFFEGAAQLRERLRGLLGGIGQAAGDWFHFGAQIGDKPPGFFEVLASIGWKEVVLTNVQADASKEIDLGEVLPGAKLVIKKIGGRKPQRTIEATLEGPAAVYQLELKTKVNTRQGGHSSSSDRRTTTSGTKTIRHVMIQSYEFQMGEEPKDNPLILVVRYPQDPKRERVRFKLTALDLL